MLLHRVAEEIHLRWAQAKNQQLEVEGSTLHLRLINLHKQVKVRLNKLHSVLVRRIQLILQLPIHLEQGLLPKLDKDQDSTLGTTILSLLKKIQQEEHHFKHQTLVANLSYNLVRIYKHQLKFQIIKVR